MSAQKCFDTIKKEITDREPQVAPEILVGDTSRTLSEELKSAALDGKPEDSWVWAFAYKDGKLAIYANCQSAFDMALQALRDEYIKDGVFSVSNKLLCLCKLIYLPQLV